MIGKLTALESLCLHENSLTGQWFTSGSQVVNMRTAFTVVPGAHKTGMIPAQVGALKLLHRLQLNNNKLSGDRVVYACATGLFICALLTGGVPREIGENRRLTSLQLHRNAFTGDC